MYFLHESLAIRVRVAVRVRVRVRARVKVHMRKYNLVWTVRSWAENETPPFQ
jgi:hypothetical protein